MQRILLYLVALLFCSISYGQLACPILTNPQNNATDVAVDASISWTPVEGVPAFLISIGTTEGGEDIVARTNVGSATTYNPPLGLPENVDIFVTITLFFFDREDVVCTSQQFRTETISEAPSCTLPTFPADGATNVDIATSIAWENAPRATGYRLTIGTSPGASDILDNRELDNSLSYRPDQDLPVDQEIFVRIVPFNTIGPAAKVCTEYSFVTGALALLPQCTSLISPSDGATNVPLTPVLEWIPVPDANGYKVSIGSSPFDNDVLDNVAFSVTSTPVIDFEPNRTFFVTIIPFNDAGNAIGCIQTSFSTILGCGPFLGSDGELVSFQPDVNFPDTVSFCQNETPYTVSTNDTADGFRWFRINSDETEELLSTTSDVALSDEGTYRYEAYNSIIREGSTIECSNSKIFTVLSSEAATNVELDIAGQDGNIRITVSVDGIGDYEYALDAMEGPYQENGVFENVPIGFHTVYVRDKNGCGIVEETIEPDLTLEGFPKFFTPNGDGINDFWQFVPPPELSEIPIATIHIFDRYGTLIAQIDPLDQGWDGRFKGKSLPASDYWFKAISNDQQGIQGHFSLKR